MAFIDELIEHGTIFEVRRREDGASFSPASGRDEDLEAFQGVVRELRRNEGDGYQIEIDHESSERAGRFTDLVVVRFTGQP